MRGVALVVAVTVVAEVGDFRRFANARQLMAYLGLVPSEHSSGASVRRGGITKAGNVLARRVLIEGAWTYRMPARISRKLHDRNEKLSPAVRTSGSPVVECGQPTPIGQRPRPNPSIDLVVAQQEALQMLACFGQYPARRCPRPHQVTHGFMGGVGDPDRRQLAGAVQLGQHHCVAAIGLHPVARFDRDQRWSHHDAVMSTTGQQPVQPITTRAGFVAKAQRTSPFAQPGGQLRQKLGTVLENTELANLAAAATFGKRDADRRLVHIRSDIGIVPIRPVSSA